jgi:hypothetical protein
MAKKVLFFAILGAVVALQPSCRKGVPAPITILPPDQVYYSDESRLTEPAEMVVRNSEEWWRTWGQVTGSVSDPPAQNFRSTMLLVVNGGRMNPGDRVQIDRLERRGEELVVLYRIIEDCGTLRSDVFPVQVVRAERQNRPVRFESQRVKAPHCR